MASLVSSRDLKIKSVSHVSKTPLDSSSYKQLTFQERGGTVQDNVARLCNATLVADHPGWARDCRNLKELLFKNNENFCALSQVFLGVAQHRGKNASTG